jgi:hypothetical protein
MTNSPPTCDRRPNPRPKAPAIPYIATWSGEHNLNPAVIMRGGSGIGYADETLLDRDDRGTLWTRMPSRPGHGRPDLGQVHSLRQRRTMRRLLCQVCAQPADRNEQGVLWLLRDHREDWPDWPEGMANTYPPLCLPCARASVRLCPVLRPAWVAVRARRFPLTGVMGVRYTPSDRFPVPTAATVVAYDDPAIRWTRAAQQVRSLHDCTIVSLNQLDRTTFSEERPPQARRCDSPNLQQPDSQAP